MFHREILVFRSVLPSPLLYFGRGRGMQGRVLKMKTGGRRGGTEKVTGRTNGERFRREDRTYTLNYG